MIGSRQDLRQYIQADLKANKKSSKYSSLLYCRMRGEYNLLFLLYLRRLEYVRNCQKGLLQKINGFIVGRRLRHWSAFTGISIQPNSFGRGLYLPHWGSIVVNGTARFGDDCVVQNGVNVSDHVRGGNHLYLGAGAKILSDVELADDIIVGANAVVNKSVSTPNVVVAGVPASIVSEKGFRDREHV